MTPDESERVPVFFTDRLGPNFLWHMLAVAKISYDSEYAERFRDSVGAKNLETLVRHAPLLRFGNGETSALTGFFTFLPAWLHIESKPDFEGYFRAADRCLGEGSLRVFCEEFARADWADPWYHHFCSDPGFPPAGELRRQAAELAAAYLESFNIYRDEIWPVARQEMATKRTELTDFFSRHDFVLDWEKAFGMKFQTPSYEIVLCHANRCGPDYNSLGYGGNLFYYGKPFERMWQLVSHEIGTHLLFECMMDLIGEGRYDQGKLHRANEVMAMFFNRRILGRGALAYELTQYDGPKLLDFYAREYREGMNPEELLRRAAETFCLI